MAAGALPKGYQDVLTFPLLEALLGRRSRRFGLGMEIPDGVLQYRSEQPPEPLSELEKLLVVTACGGNTSFHHLLFRAQVYAPHLSNYSGAAGGRTFPSAAGFHTSKTFFTDDSGVYVLENRDAPAFADRDDDGRLDPIQLLATVRTQVTKLEDGRLRLPPETPYVEAHNTWVVNRPGTLLVMPIGDLAQHVLLGLCYMLQNGIVLYDDVHRRAIPGIERFRSLVDTENVWPLTFLEQSAFGELTVELGTSSYAGALLLQAMGLGGWMFNGIDPFALLGASGKPEAPGLGFDFEVRESWPYPNVTGRAGALEAHCPPNFPDMRAAVEAVAERKFGPGGPFHPDTPGPFKDSRKVRSAAKPHDDSFKECVAHQAQYVFDTFGKFPGTVPSVLVFQYLQAFHLDLGFYDTHFAPGAYLRTHAEHFDRWHR
jgi:hypothetical protein